MVQWLGPCCALRKAGWGSRLLVSAWSNPGCYGALGSEPVDESSLPKSTTDVQINKINFRKDSVASDIFMEVINNVCSLLFKVMEKGKL